MLPTYMTTYTRQQLQHKYAYKEKIKKNYTRFVQNECRLFTTEEYVEWSPIKDVVDKKRKPIRIDIILRRKLKDLAD